MRRIQGLIAKAESTDQPAEAEALLAKAQTLMAKHAIDEAMLNASRHADREAVTSQIVHIDAPYASAKSTLLAAIAQANNVKAVGHRNGNYTLVGFPSDITATEVMFASLSLHATREMLATPVPYYDTPRAFRHAFIIGFAGRISRRLKEAAERAQREYEDESGASTAIVLANKNREVEDAFSEMFPRIRQRSASTSSRSGGISGGAAADRANLSRSVGGGQRALG